MNFINVEAIRQQLKFSLLLLKEEYLEKISDYIKKKKKKNENIILKYQTKSYCKISELWSS